MIISHMVFELNDDKAWSTVKVFVKTHAAIPKIAIAPIGRGLTTIHTIEVMKIANRCQACTERPSGAGVNHIPKTRLNTNKPCFNFTPSQPVLVATAVAVL